MANNKQFVMADFSEAGAALGAVSGMAKVVRTDRYLADVVKMVHSGLSKDFDLYMDGLYALAPRRFHHVYEWGSHGGPGGRLWKHTLMGGGANRNASWEWVASKKAIPSPQQRANNPDDPMSQLSQDEVAEFSKQRYYFYWKAPVMETGYPVYITPSYTKSIAFPIWDKGDGQTIAFSKGTTIENPGGDEVQGAFTTAWTQWWAEEAPRRFEERIAPVVENDLSRDFDETVRRTSRRRKGSVGISAMTDFNRAFKISEEWMMDQSYSRSRGYQRRYTLNGDDEL